MPLETLLVIIGSSAGGVAILRGPIGRALAARIEGRKPLDDEGRWELGELRERVAALEAERAELAELQERLDFAERMLAESPTAPLRSPLATAPPRPLRSSLHSG
jgi:hypothetical protein